MKDLLSKLKDGAYEFKDPWRASEKSLTLVVPIVSREKASRGYFVLEEVQDKVKIFDTGGIHGVQVKSDVDEPTFIRGGTMLKGATQERATQFGFVVMPGCSETVLVHCIHASRGIHRGASFRASGHAPFRVYSSILSEKSQSQTWSEVNKFSERMACAKISAPDLGMANMHAMRDDLVAAVEKMEAFRKDLTDILKQIPDYVDQVGTVIIDPNGVLGLEMYDHPDSWKAFSKSIMRSFSEALGREDSTGIFKPDMETALGVVRKFLAEIETFEEEEVFSKSAARTVILKAEGYVGEYTALDGKTIHFLVTKTDRPEPTMRRIELLPIRPEVRQESTVQRILNWGKRKMDKGAQVIEAIRERPKTWTKLRSEVTMSKATLSSRLKELQESGVVERHKGENGVVRYGLTGLGQASLGRVEPLRSQTYRDHVINSLMLRSSEVHTTSTDTEDVCPRCGSVDVVVWGFDKNKADYECKACLHKWIKPRI